MVTAFTVSELLRENQQTGEGEGGGVNRLGLITTIAQVTKNKDT